MRLLTSLALPQSDAAGLVLLPTMKPVMFCRNTRGILRWQQSSMKGALQRAFTNRMPLLAMMPTG